MPGIMVYARLVGIVLLVVAASGLALFGWDAAAIYFDASVGLFFLFVGSARLEPAVVRQMAGGLGVLLALVMGVTIVASWLLPTRYLHGPIEISSLVVGGTSILAARYLPDRRCPRGGRRVS